MNKKISTLLAGVMLASAFSVNAAMENGKSYLLKSGSSYLSAETDKTSADYGKLVYGSLNTSDLNEVVAGTWKVSTKTTSGAVVYTFVNKVTGMTLAVDPTLAKTATNGLSGDVTVVRFLNGHSMLVTTCILTSNRTQSFSLIIRVP